MGSSLEDEKTSNAHNYHVDQPVPTETPTRFVKFTNFVAHWGVETNGFVFPADE